MAGGVKGRAIVADGAPEKVVQAPRNYTPRGNVRIACRDQADLEHVNRLMSAIAQPAAQGRRQLRVDQELRSAASTTLWLTCAEA